MIQWPFPVQEFYLPNDCNALQIESLTKSRIVQSNIYIGDQFPYLHITTYQHPDAQLSVLKNKPNGKWLPLPEKYDIDYVLDKDIYEHPNLLIPSGVGQLYWRCRSKDLIPHILNSKQLHKKELKLNNEM